MKKINIKKTFKTTDMKAEKMKKELVEKFGRNALRQTIWLHTRKEIDVEELNTQEVESIYHLFYPKKQEVINFLEQEQRIKKYRSIVLKDAQYLGLYDPQNWARFNNYMLKYSPSHKSLKDYKEDEFPQLIRQFKSMRIKYEKEAKVPFTDAWYHKNRLPKPSNN